MSRIELLYNNRIDIDKLLNNKFYHVIFWLTYQYMWWVIALANPLKAATAILFTPFIIKFLFYTAFQAMVVYLNLYYLFPQYLEKGKLTRYLLLLSASILGSSLIIVGGYYISAILFNTSTASLYGEQSCFYLFFGEALPSTLATATLMMSIKLGKEWVKSNKKAKEGKIITEDIEAKYLFVKSGSKHKKLLITDILFIQGMQNYIVIYTLQGSHIIHMTMKSVEVLLDQKAFTRVHRSYIISLSKVDSVEGNRIQIKEHSIPVSRVQQKSLLRDILNSVV